MNSIAELLKKLRQLMIRGYSIPEQVTVNKDEAYRILSDLKYMAVYNDTKLRRQIQDILLTRDDEELVNFFTGFELYGMKVVISDDVTNMEFA